MAIPTIAERPVPDLATFRDVVVPGQRPVVLRSAAGDWPLVRAARGGHDWLGVLRDRASDEPVEILRADPTEQGRFHYAADGRRLNFVRGRAPLVTFVRAIEEEAKADRPHALAVQGLPAERVLPGFSASHPMPLVPPGTPARLWIGNAAKVATHNNPTDNLAVVAAGRRRFTLFPPDAAGDLHLGPAHPTPAGTPISMVHVTAPDLDRYPDYARALAVAEAAELGPGDAIFIPRDWYHHVEALERFNMLANYWW